MGAWTRETARESERERERERERGARDRQSATHVSQQSKDIRRWWISIHGIVGNVLLSHPYPTGDTATNTSAPTLRLPIPLPARGVVAVSYSISITVAERSEIKVGKPHASGKLPT